VNEKLSPAGGRIAHGRTGLIFSKDDFGHNKHINIACKRGGLAATVQARKEKRTDR